MRGGSARLYLERRAVRVDTKQGHVVLGPDQVRRDERGAIAAQGQHEVGGRHVLGCHVVAHHRRGVHAALVQQPRDALHLAVGPG